MDPRSPPPPCCPCSCARCGASTWLRSVKRKVDQTAEAAPPLSPAPLAARVDLEIEVAALREALARQQQTINDLCVELDEERSAAASAASEAMSMILRLQREKAEAQMEARQFKRFAEEKMAHDQQQLLALDDLLFRRDQALQSLALEVQAYRHRLLSLGADDADVILQFDPPPEFDYPPLRCDGSDNEDDVDNYEHLEDRIYQLETAPGSSHVKVVDPAEEFPESERSEDEERDRDDVSDRVYTIDAVHGMAPPKVVGVCGEDSDLGSPRSEKWEKGMVGDGGGEGELEGDMKKLYMRLQALEADRESMRQAILSMRTEKAQLVLLKEIAQQLCKEVKPERKAVKKPPPSLLATFSIHAVIKWVMSFIFWRRKASRSRYSFGLSNNNVGLLLLLDKSPRTGHWSRLKNSKMTTAVL